MSKLTNLQKVQSVIAYECIDKGDLKKKEAELLKRYTELAEESYILVQWPWSQELMEKKWFKKEAILEAEGKTGSSSYFIPLKRLL